VRRIPGAADPVPVRLAWPDAWHERVPDVGVVVPQRYLGLRAFLVEQAQVTPSATAEASAKLVPTLPKRSPGVAPSGYGVPGIAAADPLSGFAKTSGATRAPGIRTVAC
jgi:hypothetical protein